MYSRGQNEGWFEFIRFSQEVCCHILCEHSYIVIMCMQLNILFSSFLLFPPKKKLLSRNIGRRLSKSTFHLIFSFQFPRVVVCVRVCVVTCVMVQLTEIIAGSAEKKEKKNETVHRSAT